MKKRRWKKLYGSQVSFVCPYCLRTLPLKESTKDHIIPRSRGGKTEPSNLILCCKHDNANKGALTLPEYREWLRLETIRNGGKQR